MATREKFHIYTSDNDYYLGEALTRYLSKEDKEVELFNNRVPEIENFREDSSQGHILVGVLNFTQLENPDFVNLITDLTGKQKRVFLLSNESINNFPPSWGEFHLIDASNGLNREILDTLILKRSIKEDDIHNPKKAKEEKIRLEEEKRLREIREVQKRKEEEEQLKIATSAASLRKFKRAIQFRDPKEMVVEIKSENADVKKGIDYLLGNGVPKDGTRAYTLFNKALKADPEDFVAEYYRGVCLIFDYGIQENTETNNEIEQVINKAFEKDIIPAIIMRGGKLSHDLSTAREGTEIFTRLLSLGYPKAKYYIGLGKEMEGKLEEALELYYEAAEDKIPEAQNALGCLFAEGLGVKKNIDIAREWFEQAASNNLPEANENLEKLVKLSSGKNTNTNKPDVLLYEDEKGKDNNLNQNVKNFNLQDLKNLDREKVEEIRGRYQEKLKTASLEVLTNARDNALSITDWVTSKFKNVSKVDKVD